MSTKHDMPLQDLMQKISDLMREEAPSVVWITLFHVGDEHYLTATNTTNAFANNLVVKIAEQIQTRQPATSFLPFPPKH